MEIFFAGTSSSANAHGNGSWLTIVVVLGNVKSFTVFRKKGCCCAKRRFLANPEAMKVLADESCAGPVIRALREAGHDVVVIVEVPKGATDEQVLERALNEECVPPFHTGEEDFPHGWDRHLIEALSTFALDKLFWQRLAGSKMKLIDLADQLASFHFAILIN